MLLLLSGKKTLIAFSLVVASGTSCASQGSGHTYRGATCEVTVPESWSPELARIIALVCEPIVPQVAEMLSVPVEREVRVEMLKSRLVEEEEGTYGVFLGGPPATIVLGAFCIEDASRLEMSLAHEIAHLHMCGPGWDRVPYVIEEGIAKLVERRFWRGGELNSPREVVDPAHFTRMFALTFSEIRELPIDERNHLFRVGLEVVQQVGLTHILAMLKDDRLTIDHVLEALARGGETQHD